MSPMNKLTQEKIINAAFEFADLHGLESLSMRKIAEQLHVKAMSLYNHIKNKDELLDLLIEQLVKEIEVPSNDEPWMEAMRKRAQSMHTVLLKHPWGTLPLVSRINIGPIFLHFFDRSLGCLVTSGFSRSQADQIIVLLNAYIYGFTLYQLNFPIKETDYVTEANIHKDLFPISLYPTLHALSTDVRQEQYSGIADFNLGLDIILAGIALKYNKYTI